ncbi:hypothetical protein REPUB_Repub03eG0079600 [Reevesia pubescens]
MLLVKPPFFTSLSWVRLSPPFLPLVSMLRPWNTRTSALPSKMLMARTRSNHCGDITSKTHKDLFLRLIAMIVIVWLKLEMSCT